jgi:caffeoyl-CoA O-methyltransferase
MIEGGEIFDMAFIDANKKDYDTYYEQVLQLLPPGGLIAFDNVFWSGKLLDENRTEKSTVALRALNKKLHTDARVSISMLPLNDGMTLCWKRPVYAKDQ